MKVSSTTVTVLLLIGCAGDTQQADVDAAAAHVVEQLGTVQFVTSCSAAAVPHFERGLALLHHMTYEMARGSFAEAAQGDPECAIAYWGQAMTFIHPLWHDPPDQEKFQQGLALLNEAKRRGRKSDLESAFIAAADAYYSPGRSSDEAPALRRFDEAWQEVYEQYPDHAEASTFHALARLGTADPGDKTYQKQTYASDVAEKVLASVPDHPGAHHYVIHANDYPGLAEKALAVARSYGNIAPAIPHALHMPTHIFTRLGLWQESIDYNARSADAALMHPAGEATSLHYLHALDYLAYAYLQGAEDRRAAEVQKALEALDGPLQVHLASAYTLAGIPARIALERHAWSEAASLQPRSPDAYPWDSVPAMEAISYFARALGAARTGSFDQARADLRRMEVLYEQIPDAAAYWAKQVEIQRLSAQAWLEFEEGDRDRAIETMRSAAEMEATTEKHPVTPGEILPARELYADMLLELGRYDEALAEYRTSLDRSPNRFNSLYGAGRAAEETGDVATAAYYYQQLVKIAAKADTQRERLQRAKSLLATN